MKQALADLRHRLARVLSGPPILAFLPALTLGAYWLGGEGALLLMALSVPLLFGFAGLFSRQQGAPSIPRDSVTGLMLRDGFEKLVAQIHEDTEVSGLKSACFMLELDDYKQLVDRHGQQAADEVMQRTGDRLISTLRASDSVARMGDSRFAICLIPVRQLDLELCLQMAGRLQAAIEEPISVGGLAIYMSGSIGFCMRSRAPSETGSAWLEAAQSALTEAQQNGPSSIRAFSADLHRRNQTKNDLREEAAAALENGQIHAWYQPQISTDTGKVTGFEALARWVHPERGMIGPDLFLPALEEANLLERLGEVMLYHALTALKAWDSAGCDVPKVGVNFAPADLQNPRLVEKIQWELDRFDIYAARLSVEILETVVTDAPSDVVVRNIQALGEIGCGIDLDDYGTGHASIASIRRFPVSRIKIDRSFVMKADRDPEQQRLVGALLTMAERLGLETLAEGVETVGEHALLAQLGCDHVQGFGIARPMPFDQTLDWITAHLAKLHEPPQIGRETG
ncbi:bifunctional diguanylate cyclase/phosphodiesterase [Thalassococcus sp. S3]|uniref:putative bifunctional diguanylate cyclase/phosphodiesterase n=1 Tax=Thalassococcus sp. S3 TaxID=2017482 RepID=UPI001023FAD9|nr:bifunctional diguanylate cyclase/phosphodiesterase [Thalassococcus sp. S3]QBF30153.1 diguanylate cyclase [Thalassococcus sp. S3]